MIPMTLGTVQLGMNYGIANNGGKPSEELAHSILAAALEGGVAELDTARAYGDSEEVIGRFLKKTTLPAPRITTKIPHYKGDGGVERHVLGSVESSLERLGIEKLASVMLHAAGDLAAYGDEIVSALESVVKRGWAERVGVSVYTEEELRLLLQYDALSVTQLPMSIFDQRLLTTGILDRLKQRGFAVHVRSVFLQGLFFLDPQKIQDPELLLAAEPYLSRLHQLAEREGLTVAQLAIAFIRDLDGVTSLVLGADSPQQVKQNLSYFDTKPLSDALLEELKAEFSQVDVPAIMRVLSRSKK